jgi:chromosome segregation ATPase
VEDYKKANEELQEKIRSLEDTISTMQYSGEGNDHYSSTIESLEIELTQTQETLREYEMKLLKLEQDGHIQLQSKEDQIRILQEQLSEYESMIHHLQEGADVAQRTILDITETKDILQSTLEQFQSSAVGVKELESLEALQQSLERHLKVEKELRDRIELLSKEVNEANQVSNDYQNEITSLQAFIKEQADSLVLLEHRLAQVESESAGEIARLLSKIEELESLLNTSRGPTNGEQSLQMELERLENEYNQLVQTRDADLMSLQEQSARALDMKAQIDIFLQKQDELSVEFDQATEQLDIISRHHGFGTVHEARGFDSDILADFRVLSRKIFKFIEQLESRIEDLSHTPTSVSVVTEVERLKDEVQRLEQEKQQLEQSVDSTYIEELRQLVETQNAEIDQLRQSSRREQQVDDLEIAELRLRNEELIVKIAEYEMGVPDDSSELHRLKEQLALQNQAHQQELGHLQDQLRLYENSAPSNEFMMVEELQTVNQEQKHELDLLRKELAQLNESHYQEILQMQQQIGEATQAAGSPFVADTVEKLQIENENQMFEIESLRAELKEQHKHYERELQRIQHELENMVEEKEESQMFQQELRVENENQLVELESLRMDLAQQETLHLLEIQGLQEKLNSVFQYERKFYESEKENSLLKKQLDELFSDLTAKDAELLSLRRQDESKQESSWDDFGNDAVELEILQQSLRESESRCSELLVQITELQAERDILVRENESVKEYNEKQANDHSLLLESMKEIMDQNSVLKKQLQENEALASSRHSLESQLHSERDGHRQQFEKLAWEKQELQRVYEELQAVYSNLLTQKSDEPVLPSTAIEELSNQLELTRTDLMFSEERVLELEAIIDGNQKEYQKLLEAEVQSKTLLEVKVNELLRDIEHYRTNQMAAPSQEDEVLRSQLMDAESRIMELEVAIEENNRQFESYLNEQVQIRVQLEKEVQSLRESTVEPDIPLELESELISAKQQMQELEEKNLRLEILLEEEKERLDIIVAEAQSTKLGLESEIVELKSNISSANQFHVEELNAAKALLEEKSILLETIEQEQMSYLENSSKVDSFVQELQKELHDKDTELISKNFEIEKLELQLQEFEVRVQQLEIVVAQNKEHYDELLVEEQAKRLEIEARFAVISEASNQVVDANELDQLRMDLRESDDRIVQLESIIDENKQYFEQILQEEQAKKDALEQRVQELTNQLEDTNRDLLNEKTHLEHLVMEKDLALSGLTETDGGEVDQLRMDLQESEERVVQLESIIEENKQYFEQILQEEQAKKDALEQRVQELTDQLEDTNRDLLNEKTHLEHLVMEKDLALSGLTETDGGEVDQLRMDLQESEERVVQLESIIEENKRYFETILSQESEKVSILEERLNSITNTVEESTHQASHDKSELESILEEKHHELVELRRLNDELQLSAQQSVLSGVSAEYQKQWEDLSWAYQESEQRVVELEQIIESNRLQFEEILQQEQSRRYQLEAQLENVDQNGNRNVIAEFESQLEEKKQFIEYLEHELEQIRTSTSASGELAEAELQIQTLEQSLVQTRSKLEDALEKHTESIQGYETQISNLQNRLNDALAEKLTIADEVEEYKQKLTEKDLSLQTLQETLQTLREESDSSIHAKSLELENTLLQLETSIVKIRDLEGQVSAAQEAVAQWETYCNSTLAEQDAYYQSQMNEMQSKGNENSDDSRILELEVPFIELGSVVF